ncbi:uncharacterized protein LOC133845469 [Drosophila sulfurigaster albostrigata]|uniref:uncharacterized protein LOC133845469 n=1 Tax=Drosophila sulfurigaster albostrigata TaxID=89887 RepID=UPI002D21831F|nr:uncharacterized protein LOC133845469 [Drosophila sulfurigaster albostrigata]
MGHVTYTNLKCILRNSTILAFQNCYIKAVNRTHKYIAIHINNYSRDVFNVSMNIKVLRFNHGYKPFFFDITFDACKYMKTQNDPIVNLFFNSFKHASNLNHTCPFNHDIIVDKLWTGNHEVDFLKYLPVPNGDYMLPFTVYSNNLELLTIQVFVHLTT